MIAILTRSETNQTTSIESGRSGLVKLDVNVKCWGRKIVKMNVNLISWGYSIITGVHGLNRNRFCLTGVGANRMAWPFYMPTLMLNLAESVKPSRICSNNAQRTPATRNGIAWILPAGKGKFDLSFWHKISLINFIMLNRTFNLVKFNKFNLSLVD